jgi:hypothetical protein
MSFYNLKIKDTAISNNKMAKQPALVIATDATSEIAPNRFSRCSYA